MKRKNKRINYFILAVLVVMLILYILFQFTSSKEGFNDSALKECPEAIHGLQFKYPINWGGCYIQDENLYFETTHPDYNVKLYTSFNEVDEELLDFSSLEMILEEDNLAIYQNFCGGVLGCFIIKTSNRSYYEMTWNVISDQPVPDILNYVWVPDYEFTSEDILRIMTSVRYK